jgi:hypothetical protein
MSTRIKMKSMKQMLLNYKIWILLVNGSYKITQNKKYYYHNCINSIDNRIENYVVHIWDRVRY